MQVVYSFSAVSTNFENIRPRSKCVVFSGNFFLDATVGVQTKWLNVQKNIYREAKQIDYAFLCNLVKKA